MYNTKCVFDFALVNRAVCPMTLCIIAQMTLCIKPLYTTIIFRCMCVYAYVCVCVYIHTCTNVCIHVCIYITQITVCITLLRMTIYGHYVLHYSAWPCLPVCVHRWHDVQHSTYLGLCAGEKAVCLMTLCITLLCMTMSTCVYTQMSWCTTLNMSFDSVRVERRYARSVIHTGVKHIICMHTLIFHCGIGHIT